MQPDVFLQKLREHAGLSQTEVAEAAGIPQPVVSYIESGKRSPEPQTIEMLKTAILEMAETRHRDAVSFAERHSL